MKTLSFLKKTPIEDTLELLAYFPSIDVSAVDAAAKRTPRAKAMLAAINTATGRDRDRIVALIDDLEQFGSEEGWRALRHALPLGCDAAELLDQSDDPRGCAIRVWLHDPATLERAQSIHYADRYRNGRSWAWYAIGDGGPIEVHQDNVARTVFETKVREAFAGLNGAGRCHVDWFSRLIDDPSRGTSVSCLQATIYAEGPARSEAVFDDDAQIDYRARRPVIEGAVLIEPQTGSLEIVSKGGEPIKRALSDAVAEALLTSDLALTRMIARQLDLECLRTRRDFEIPSAGPVVAVDVEMLRVAQPCGLLETKEWRGDRVIDEDIYAAVSRNSDASALQMPGSRIIGADLRVHFQPDPGKTRGVALKVELRAPNRTNLRDQTERHRLVAREMLGRWGLLAHA